MVSGQSVVFDEIPEIQGNIYAIHQSKSGYLWIGSNKGLYRFDGLHADNYSTSSGVFELSNNYVVSLFEDSRGRLWCGTRDGLNILDFKSKTNKLIRERKGDTIPGLGHAEVRQVVEIKNGLYVIGTYGGGVTVFSESKNEFFHFVHDPKSATSLPANNVNDVFLDRQRQVWIGTESGGLSKFDIETGEFEHFTMEGDSSLYTVGSITQDSNGKLWIGTWHRGLFVLDEENHVLRRRLVHKDFYDPRNSVRRIVQFSDSTLWLGTIGGLIEFNIETSDTIGYYHSSGDQTTLNGNVIWSFEKTKDNIWWVGTVHDGLHKYDRHAHKFFPWKIDLSNQYAPKNEIVDIKMMANHELWIFTAAKEVCIYDCKANHFLDNRVFSVLKDFRMKDLKVDPFGQVWMVTTGGLLRWNRNKNKIDLLEHHMFQKGDAEVGGVYDLGFSPEGDLYVVGWGFGLAKISMSSLQNEEINKSDIKSVEPTGKEEIDPVIWAVNVGADGVVWLGGKTKSHAYNPITNQLKVLPTKWSDVQLTKYKDKLYAIESDGHIGVVGKDATWRYLRKVDIGKDKIIKAVIDNAQRIWVSTEGGKVLRIPLDPDIVVSNYDESDGFVKGKGWSAFVPLETDKFIVLSNGQLLKANNESLSIDQTMPVIKLHEVKLFNHLLLNDSLEVSENDQVISFQEGIYYLSLGNKQNRLEFELEVQSYSSTKNVVFQYRLNSEQQWNTTSAEFPRAKYPNLQHGTHRFYGRAISADGIYSKEKLLAVIEIEAPWWLKWWAFVVYGVLAIGGIWFAFSFSLVSIKAKNKLAFESYRISKQEELNDVKMQFFTNISHELKTPLTLILGPVNKLLNETTDASQKNALSTIRRNAEHLNNLVGELLEFKRMESGISQLVREVVDANDLINEVVLNYAELASLKQIELKVSLPDESVKVEVDVQKFQKIVHNLLSNAFKYTPEKGTIVVTLNTINNKDIVLTVEDSGNGIDEALIETVFDRFVTDEKRNANAGAGTGIGLALVKQIVLAHRGAVSATNTNKGAKFEVRLPLFSTTIDLPEVRSYADKRIAEVSDVSRLLVVEDNVEIRKFVVSILENTYMVFTAANGLEALEIARTESPHLILSDVMMPEMDGFELCKKVKSDIQLSHIPIILLTARTSAADLVQGLENRADDYIPKPFDSKVLLLKIRNLLDARRTWIQNFKVLQKVEVDSLSLTSIDEKFLNDVLATIENKMEEADFNVEVLSKEIGMHRSHLTRKLTALTEFSPVEFIRHIRLTKAMELLKTGKLTVSDVAYRVGYDNPRYFSTSFKKQFGKTPTEVLTPYQ